MSTKTKKTSHAPANKSGTKAPTKPSASGKAKPKPVPFQAFADATKADHGQRGSASINSPTTSPIAEPTTNAASDHASNSIAKPERSKPDRTGATRAKPQRGKRLSALDAAFTLLSGSDSPMSAKDLVAAAAARGLWSSPGGKTPEATLYAAILREINAKGDKSRFKKTARGLFAATKGN